MKKTLLIFMTLFLCLLVILSCEDDDESYVEIPNDIISGEFEFELYTNTLDLNGIILPEGLTGFWEVIENTDPYTLSDSLNPNCQFTGELLGQYKLRWTVTNGKDEKYADIAITIIGFTDSRDDEEYRVVKIGNQIWMAENLNTTEYQNGDLIMDGSSVGDYSAETQPKYWFAYDDNLSNVEKYGRLYTWYAATDSRKVCPDGWHIPSDTEWNILHVNLGINPEDTDLICDENNTISGKLKETGTLNWIAPNTGATDEYEFTALPAGYRRRFNKDFDYKGEYACFWTSTEWDYEKAWYRHLYYDKENICRTFNLKNYGFSIRCVKD